MCLRGDHVGERNKGLGVGVWEFVGAGWHWSDSVAGEHLGDGVDVNGFVLFVVVSLVTLGEGAFGGLVPEQSPQHFV